MPFTIPDAMSAIGHGVLVDPFPREPKFTTNLTKLIRAYPDLGTWRRIADWLEAGGDNYGPGRRGKPDLGVFIARFGGWMQQACSAPPTAATGNALSLLPECSEMDSFPPAIRALLADSKVIANG